MSARADVVIIGAGIAGVAAAHALTAGYGLDKVVVIDPRPPLSLTSDKSTECYRNYWPNREMTELMIRSIDLLNQYSGESGESIGLNRRGYLYVTADPGALEALLESAQRSAEFGSGPVRIHTTPDHYGEAEDGFDVLANATTLHALFPYLTERALGALHVRRAGWLSAQQLGRWMLDRSYQHGAQLIVDEVLGIEIAGRRVKGVQLASGRKIRAGVVVNAAGPLSPGVALMAGVDLPVFSEMHLKVAFKEHLGIVPRDAPMIIWSDPQRLDWTADERSELERQGRSDVTGDMPVFCHGRPEGGEDSPYLLSLWDYHATVTSPVWPLEDDPLYPEVVMRGMATMVPGLTRYLDHLPHAVVDGGYYSKTRENRPLIGPAGPEGFFLVAAMSGFGVMVAAGAADLVARHITDDSLPSYSDAFLLSRYEDPAYLAEIEAADQSGQL